MCIKCVLTWIFYILVQIGFLLYHRIACRHGTYYTKYGNEMAPASSPRHGYALLWHCHTNWLLLEIVSSTVRLFRGNGHSSHTYTWINSLVPHAFAVGITQFRKKIDVPFEVVVWCPLVTNTELVPRASRGTACAMITYQVWHGICECYAFHHPWPLERMLPHFHISFS